MKDNKNLKITVSDRDLQCVAYGLAQDKVSACHSIPEKNKDRFCNTIATVALIDTSTKSDQRLQTKEILSTSKSKQTQTLKLPRKPMGQTLTLCKRDVVLKRSTVLITEEER